VASANGGLSFESDEQGAAGELMVGLRAAAYAELARLGNVDLQTEDGTCRMSLEKLLAAADSADPKAAAVPGS
jgi:thioredoxin-like negative regulator of GroEL